MPKRRDHAEQLRRYAAGERIDITPYLRTLPDDIPVELVLPILRDARAFFLGRQCRALPPHVIRAHLAADVPGANHLFLRLAVTEDDLVGSWARALKALLDLDLSYSWGSAPRRQRFRTLAKDQPILAAIQGTVANSPEVSRDMLAVLVADASEASLDALIPHLDAALVGRDRRLERLVDLRIHAKRIPVLDRMFAEIDESLASRNRDSPALALGPLIGVGHVDPLWFDASIHSRERRGGVPRVQASVNVHSRVDVWFCASVWSGDKHTSFTCKTVEQDEAEVGSCTAADTPAWLARIATTLGIIWQRPSLLTGLRGAHREALARWLLP